MSHLSHSRHSSKKSKDFLLCCPRECALSMFYTNPGLCHSALHWPGAGRQLCRNRVAWDAGALLWRRAPLHTQLRQEVMAALWPPSWLDERAVLLHRQTANASLLSHIRKSLTLKYYAKKILYFLRQQNILKSMKSFLERPAEQQSALEGVALYTDSITNTCSHTVAWPRGTTVVHFTLHISTEFKIVCTVF